MRGFSTIRLAIVAVIAMFSFSFYAQASPPGMDYKSLSNIEVVGMLAEIMPSFALPVSAKIKVTDDLALAERGRGSGDMQFDNSGYRPISDGIQRIKSSVSYTYTAAKPEVGWQRNLL